MTRSNYHKRAAVFAELESLNMDYTVYEHPPLDTIEIALEYWKDIDATHCKNLFFRNHKGNRHYLCIIQDTTPFDIHALEQQLRQGKLSFASPQRLEKHLGLTPGSVSPFGLINDTIQHVTLFLDKHLQQSHRISFHPNDNTASVVISYADFLRYLEHRGNQYSFIDPSPNLA